MQQDQNPHDKIIDQLTSFGKELLDWDFPNCADEVLYDQHVARQHEHDVYDEDAGRIPVMWENWLNISSEAQSLDNLLGVSFSTCILPLSITSSQTSANFLPCRNTSGPEPIKTCFISHQGLPLASTTLPNYVEDKHHLHSLYERGHVDEPSPQQLDTGTGNSNGNGRVTKSAAQYSPPSEMSAMAPVSPPPVDVKTTAPRQALSCYMAKSSSQRRKQAEVAKNFRNSRVRKIKEAETYCLAETMEDDYVWLKYGQKSIKNRMHPRGYFKCAHPNCPVKKRAELAPDMQGSLLVTYIGEHNHLKSRFC